MNDLFNRKGIPVARAKARQVLRALLKSIRTNSMHTNARAILRSKQRAPATDSEDELGDFSDLKRTRVLRENDGDLATAKRTRSSRTADRPGKRGLEMATADDSDDDDILMGGMVFDDGSAGGEREEEHFLDEERPTGDSTASGAVRRHRSVSVISDDED